MVSAAACNYFLILSIVNRLLMSFLSSLYSVRKQSLGLLLQFFILETLYLLREKMLIHQFQKMTRLSSILK